VPPACYLGVNTPAYFSVRPGVTGL